MNSPEAWFAATVVFVGEIDGIPSLRPLCEERVALFRTCNESAARAAAHRYGEAQEHTYSNSAGEAVRWRFVGVEKIVELSPVAEVGWEVASRYTRRSRRTLTALDPGAK